MSTSPVLGLPFIDGQQALPEVTHNEALLLIQITMVGVLGLQNAPPGSPAEGDSYIIGTAGSGAWSGHNSCLAQYWSGEWRFLPGYDEAGAPLAMGTAQEGLRVWRKDLNALWVWDGAAWGTSSIAAANVAFTPAGNISAATVQAAIEELDTEKVAKAGDTMTGALAIDVVGGAATISATGDTSAFLQLVRYGGNPQYLLSRVNGTRGAPTSVVTNDILGQMSFFGYGGGAVRAGARISAQAVAATPSGTDMESVFRLDVSPAGSVTTSPTLYLGRTNGLAINTPTSTVVDLLRMIWLVTYTVAALPGGLSASLRIVAVSDLGGGAGMVMWNGSAWVRMQDGAGVQLGSAAASTFTWQYLTNAPYHSQANAFGATSYTVTLGTTGIVNGARATFVREVASTGAGVWDIGGLKSLAPGQGCTVEYINGAWKLKQFWSL